MSLEARKGRAALYHSDSTLDARVGPVAAVLLLRTYGPAVEAAAESYLVAADDLDREKGRQLQAALCQFRACARDLRRQQLQAGSVGGTSELVGGEVGARSDSSSLKGWLTTDQVAVQINRSARWVVKLCARDDLSGATLEGRRWRIPQSAVDDYLDERARAHGN